MMTRLCILLAALAVIARARVAVLPGWEVPLPVLVAAGLVTVSVTVLAWLALAILRPQPGPGQPVAPDTAEAAGGGS
jgi:hypothetical protein